MLRIAYLLGITLLTTPLVGATGTELHQKKVADLVQHIVDSQEVLAADIRELRKLLNMESQLEELNPLPAEENLSERVRMRTEDGIGAAKEGEWERAKESFRQAWELLPGSYLTNFNLGLAYFRLGNTILARQMFQTALELNKVFPGREHVEFFVDPTTKKQEVTPVAAVKDEPSSIEITNLIKESESYMKSTTMGYPEKMRSTVRLLDEMLVASENKKDLIREYYPKIADSFAAFEMYDRALTVLKNYEKSLEGEVFPEHFYEQVLALEERKKEQDKVLVKLTGNEAPVEIRRKLDRDLNELRIFALQLEEFVQDTKSEDPDFAKLCERLGEYRWANREGRHVVVVNRFQELLYSSLPGTLPLERYQDTKGQKFLKDLTLLADHLKLKQVEFFNADLKVNKQTVPYMILYTYVPKHQAFIIVRLPKEDLV